MQTDSTAQAKAHYKNFIELVETTYETQKDGFDAKTDELIIQGSLRDAMEAISSAAISLRAEKNRIRTAYFKVAILFLETLHAWEYAFMMANIALEVNQYKKYFMKRVLRNKNKKNQDHTLFFDIDELFNKFELILDGID